MKILKKIIVLLLAMVSGWILFTPFDLPPFPFMFIDEAIALIIFTKSMTYLGFDVTRFIPFMRNKGKSAAPNSADDKNAPIDV
jgi:hypothetical protein